MNSGIGSAFLQWFTFIGAERRITEYLRQLELDIQLLRTIGASLFTGMIAQHAHIVVHQRIIDLNPRRRDRMPVICRDQRKAVCKLTRMIHNHERQRRISADFSCKILSNQLDGIVVRSIIQI